MFTGRYYDNGRWGGGMRLHHQQYLIMLIVRRDGYASVVIPTSPDPPTCIDTSAADLVTVINAES